MLFTVNALRNPLTYVLTYLFTLGLFYQGPAVWNSLSNNPYDLWWRSRVCQRGTFACYVHYLLLLLSLDGPTGVVSSRQ